MVVNAVFGAASRVYLQLYPGLGRVIIKADGPPLAPMTIETHPPLELDILPRGSGPGSNAFSISPTNPPTRPDPEQKLTIHVSSDTQYMSVGGMASRLEIDANGMETKLVNVFTRYELAIRNSPSLSGVVICDGRTSISECQSPKYSKGYEPFRLRVHDGADVTVSGSPRFALMLGYGIFGGVIAGANLDKLKNQVRADMSWLGISVICVDPAPSSNQPEIHQVVYPLQEGVDVVTNQIIRLTDETLYSDPTLTKGQGTDLSDPEGFVL